MAATYVKPGELDESGEIDRDVNGTGTDSGNPQYLSTV